jgi:hypothetical protein
VIIDVTFIDYMARKINIYLISSSGESSSSNHHPPYLVRGNVLLLDRRPFGFEILVAFIFVFLSHWKVRLAIPMNSNFSYRVGLSIGNMQVKCYSSNQSSELNFVRSVFKLIFIYDKTVCYNISIFNIC